MFPYSTQSISNSDIKNVIKSLKSKFLTQGPIVEKFENSVAKFVNAKYSVATNSATSALHVACLSLGLGKGDILWTANNSFVSSATCALFCGANVDFVDIDFQNYNISISHLKKLVEAKRKNKLPKIIVPINFSGTAYDQSELYKLKKKYKFFILEDSSHSLGSRYKDIKVGSCKYSDISVFSFHAVKTITTGEGGMATTNDKHLFQRMKLFRSHGISRDKKYLRKKNFGFWYYEKKLLGFNYRMTEMSAALGLSQMTRINKFISKRRQLALRYNNLLDTKYFILPNKKDISNSTMHLYIIRMKKTFNLKKYNQIFKLLRKNKVGVNLHYLPISSLLNQSKESFKKTT